MNVLIAYYSRTGITEKVAYDLKNKLNADIEKIDDGNKYKGPIGYLRGGIKAVRGGSDEIKQTSKNPSNYDLTIIASPVWGAHLAPAVSTYIQQNKENFTKIAAFVTCGSSGGEKTLKQLTDECGKPLEKSMILTKNDIANNLNNKINEFIR